MPGDCLPVFRSDARRVPNLSSSRLSATSLRPSPVCAACLRPARLLSASLTAPKRAAARLECTVVVSKYYLSTTGLSTQRPRLICTFLNQ